MLHKGYWLFEYISISSILRKAPARYGRSFLYTETDDNDLTYFLIAQAKVIRRAIDGLDVATRRFAELMMDSAVGGALQGKTMGAAGETMGDGPTAPHPFAKAEIDDSGQANKE